MYDFQYSVQATLNCEIIQNDCLLRSVDLEFSRDAGTATDWLDENGRFTEPGVEAMITGFASGLVATIHQAGQQNGADTAALLRQAIGIMEEHFVLQVRTSLVSPTPVLDGA